MESELVSSRRSPLIRECPSNRFRREPDPLVLELRATGTSDERFLDVGLVERKLRASLEQAPRPKGKTAVPDIEGVVKVRPDRANVIIVEEMRIPRISVEDEASH